MRHSKNQFQLSWEQPIIGYDKDFWSLCIEPNKDDVRYLHRSENRQKFALQMRCPTKKHLIKLTPYQFFIDHKRCLYCINPGEIGAINVDETICIFWNDEEYDLESISESSEIKFKFQCPYCGLSFEMPMKDMVNRNPKCINRECNDGQFPEIPDEYNNMTYWIK